MTLGFSFQHHQLFSSMDDQRVHDSCTDVSMQPPARLSALCWILACFIPLYPRRARTFAVSGLHPTYIRTAFRPAYMMHPLVPLCDSLILPGNPFVAVLHFHPLPFQWTFSTYYHCPFCFRQFCTFLERMKPIHWPMGPGLKLVPRYFHIEVNLMSACWIFFCTSGYVFKMMRRKRSKNKIHVHVTSQIHMNCK
jgi:hypothetical protein